MNNLYSARYHAKNYNCAHFLCDAWMHITGQDLRSDLSGFLQPVRHASKSIRHKFVRLQKPKSPCIAFMRNRFETGHVGVYIHGKILHLTESGVTLSDVDVATMGYNSVRFYKCLD